MKTLHVLRNPKDKEAQDTAANDKDSSVLLIQDGVYAKLNAHKCRNDMDARGLPGEGLAYREALYALRGGPVPVMPPALCAFIERCISITEADGYPPLQLLGMGVRPLARKGSGEACLAVVHVPHEAYVYLWYTLHRLPFALCGPAFHCLLSGFAHHFIPSAPLQIIRLKLIYTYSIKTLTCTLHNECLQVASPPDCALWARSSVISLFQEFNSSFTVTPGNNASLHSYRNCSSCFDCICA